MKNLNRRVVLTLCAGSLALIFNPQAQAAADASEQGLQRVEWKVDGVAREALVYAPATAKASSTAVVFVFHGHGGNSRNAVRSFAMNRYWPEAISVYMQGLNTPGRLTDPEGKKPGWQHSVGAQQDRDLKFFDAVLLALAVAGA